MTTFRGLIEDAWLLPNRPGLVLSLTQIDGVPEIGMQISIAGKSATIKELGRNSTDGQVASTRNCLTGRPCTPFGSIFAEWNKEGIAPEELHLIWATEEVMI